MAEKQIHNAIVTRVEDDDIGLKLRGGVFFESPSLFEGEYPYPAFPCFSFASKNGAGIFFVPAVDDEIEVERVVVKEVTVIETVEVEVCSEDEDENTAKIYVHTSSRDCEDYLDDLNYKWDDRTIISSDDVDGDCQILYTVN